MKKTLIIVISLVVVAAAAYFVFTNISKQTPELPIAETKSTSPNDLRAIYSAPTSTVIVIGTPQGSVTTRNFYQKALGAREQFIVIEQNDMYEITYDVETSGFFANIKSGPLAETRPRAEAALLSALGVNQADACKLEVGVGIESAVDIAASRQILRLSFCGTSIKQQ